MGHLSPPLVYRSFDNLTFYGTQGVQSHNWIPCEISSLHQKDWWTPWSQVGGPCCPGPAPPSPGSTPQGMHGQSLLQPGVIWRIEGATGRACGTVRKNRRGLPLGLVRQQQARHSYSEGQKNCLTFCAWQDTKLVMFLWNFHNPKATSSVRLRVEGRRQDITVPAVVSDYQWTSWTSWLVTICLSIALTNGGGESFITSRVCMPTMHTLWPKLATPPKPLTVGMAFKTSWRTSPWSSLVHGEPRKPLCSLLPVCALRPNTTSLLCFTNSKPAKSVPWSLLWSSDGGWPNIVVNCARRQCIWFVLLSISLIIWMLNKFVLCSDFMFIFAILCMYIWYIISEFYIHHGQIFVSSLKCNL